MNRSTSGAFMLAAVLAIAGCSSTGDVKSTDAGGAAAGGKGRAAADGAEIGRYGAGGARAVGGPGRGDLNDPSGPLGRRVIYFEYDSFDVLPEYVPVVAAHAGYLAEHPKRLVTLEGHADERGSSEYNIALGDQRARSVAKLMTLQGVADDQIQIVSYGEEKPAVGGHDESAWRQNRRVEISYASE